jgi:hypothetical protein
MQRASSPLPPGISALRRGASLESCIELFDMINRRQLNDAQPPPGMAETIALGDLLVRLCIVSARAWSYQRRISFLRAFEFVHNVRKCEKAMLLT